MVNVIGLGYIGLPTALMMASHGVKVVGTDCCKERVATLKRGEVTFEETGLRELFEKAVKCGIEFSSEYQTTDAYIISVPTPYDRSSKVIDPAYVVSAVESVLEVCLAGTVIVIESTVSPGTIDKYIRPIVEKRGFKIGSDIHIVHCPERIIPGNMIYELIHNDRTIGADDKAIGEKIAAYYRSFCEGKIVLTDIKTSEMTKVVENTYRAVNIAFANELAKICDKAGMDVYEVIKICNMHPRVNILNPGPGVGGHCISVDPWFLVGDFPEEAKVIGEAMNVNASMPEYVLSKIDAIMKQKGISDYGKVGLYGLTYKENVDDVRESPTLQLLDLQAQDKVGQFKVYDPWVKKDIVKNQYHDIDKFLADIELAVIMVKHDQIKENMDKLKDKLILDTCNICPLDGAYKL